MVSGGEQVSLHSKHCSDVHNRKLTEDGNVWLVLPSTDGEADSLVLQRVADQLEREREREEGEGG